MRIRVSNEHGVQKKDCEMKTIGRILCACLWMVFVVPASAASIEEFYGAYEGTTVVDAEDEIEKRDLSVVIGARERGFFVQWTTTIERGGRRKKKEYTIDFVPTDRDGVFGSAMRSNMFGQQVPLDPMAGDPYVWARLVDDTLTVYALHIANAGGYEMQVYERTLTADGLDLEFNRFRDGVAQRTVTGALTRVR